MAERVEAHFPAEMKFLELALDFFEGYARLQGMNEELLPIRLGLEEALSNVVTHGCPEDGVVLTAERMPHGVEFLIHEKGIPFDPEALERQLNDASTGDPEHGLGLRLMQNFVDEVSFKSLGKQGKQTRLFKVFAHEPVAAFADEPREASQPSVEKIPYTVRRMHPDEALDVARCAYSSYGYSYVNGGVYNPASIREIIRIGHMISIVAVTDDGEVMGHGAMLMDEKDPLCAGWGLAFVRKRFRRQGCLKAITDVLLVEAQKLSLQWVFVDAVCSHPYSQRAAHDYGLQPSALLLARATPLNLKGLANTEKRENLLFCFCRIAPMQSSVPLYLPTRHGEMIEQLYQGLGEDREFLPIPDDVDFPVQPFVLDIVADSMAAVTLTVEEYGPGIADEVRKALGAACLDGTEGIYLQLDLSDPNTANMVPEFESMGFFFGGIFPRSTGKDHVIFQYLNNLTIDYDALQLDSPLADILKEYVALCESQSVKPWS